VTKGEIYVVLGLFMLVGIIQKPTLRSYSTTKRVISTPEFGDTTTRDKLELICKCLVFANNETINSFQGPKKLFKIFPVISHLDNKFQELCLPNRDISINKSLTIWKARLSFKQYLPLKAFKLGIKTYELCDAITRYLWSFLVYAGKGTEIDPPLITADTNKTTATVLKLVEPLLQWFPNGVLRHPGVSQRTTRCVAKLKNIYLN
jgi:hypothetical protein